jgi:hypothetical protein
LAAVNATVMSTPRTKPRSVSSARGVVASGAGLATLLMYRPTLGAWRENGIEQRWGRGIALEMRVAKAALFRLSKVPSS